MKKGDQQILVVKKDVLFEEHYFQGFLSNSQFDYSNKILNNYQYQRRGDAENNEDYKQLITYALLQNQENSFFIYQRAKKKKDYSEKKLFGKWSLGIGGHVDKDDDNKKKPILKSLKRELSEEVSGGDVLDIRKIGYINDDSNSVGRVHFGVVFLVKFSKDIAPLASEIAQGRMISREELIERFNEKECDFESWTEIILSNLAKINL